MLKGALCQVLPFGKVLRRFMPSYNDAVYAAQSEINGHSDSDRSSTYNDDLMTLCHGGSSSG
jgi:hypothetical protein